VTFESAVEFVEIGRRVGDGDGEIGGVGGVERQEVWPDLVKRQRLGGGHAGVVELDGRFVGLDDLGDGVGDEAMIRMAVAAVGAPGEDDLGVELVDELLDVVGDGVNVFGEGIGHSAEFAVVEVEKDGRLDAELFAGARGFGVAGGRERFSGGDLGEIVDSFFAFSGDGEVNLNALASVAGEGGAHEDFVVGMSGDGQENTGVGWGSRLREKGGSEETGHEECSEFHDKSPFLVIGARRELKPHYHF